MDNKVGWRLLHSQSLLHLFRFLCKSLKSSPRFLLVSLPNRFHVPFLGIFEIPEEFWVDLKINMRIGNVTQREFNFAKTITTSNMRLEYITYSTKYTHGNITCFFSSHTNDNFTHNRAYYSIYSDHFSSYVCVRVA